MSLRFRLLREEQGHSQEGVAAVAGVSQITWSNWEKNPPNQFEALARLSRHYGVSADYLLGLSENPQSAVGALNKEQAEVAQLLGELTSTRVLALRLLRVLSQWEAELVQVQPELSIADIARFLEMQEKAQEEQGVVILRKQTSRLEKDSK